MGRNENAIRIQLLTALIAYMLVLLLKKATHFQGSGSAQAAIFCVGGL